MSAVINFQTLADLPKTQPTASIVQEVITSKQFPISSSLPINKIKNSENFFCIFPWIVRTSEAFSDIKVESQSSASQDVSSQECWFDKFSHKKINRLPFDVVPSRRWLAVIEMIFGSKQFASCKQKVKTMRTGFPSIRCHYFRLITFFLKQIERLR